jgi:hypothetical protein
MTIEQFTGLISKLSLASVCALRDEFRRPPTRPDKLEFILAADARIQELIADGPAEPLSRCYPIWRSFCDEVNARQLSVLEIGSRVGADGTPSKKVLFPNASSYLGFDYHAGPNVDIVGDVHRLSDIMKGKQFDAIYSFSVMEHIAMPWVAAVEMIKSLKVGGICFHHVPFSWPMHELPWDFWRFTTEAYKVLFPEFMGMRIEATGCDHPMRSTMVEVVDGYEDFNLHRTYAFFGARLRKVQEVNLSGYRWPATVQQLLGQQSRYPEPLTWGRYRGPNT